MSGSRRDAESFFLVPSFVLIEHVRIGGELFLSVCTGDFNKFLVPSPLKEKRRDLETGVDVQTPNGKGLRARGAWQGRVPCDPSGLLFIKYTF